MKKRLGCGKQRVTVGLWVRRHGFPIPMKVILFDYPTGKGKGVMLINGDAERDDFRLEEVEAIISGSEAQALEEAYRNLIS